MQLRMEPKCLHFAYILIVSITDGFAQVCCDINAVRIVNHEEIQIE